MNSNFKTTVIGLLAAALGILTAGCGDDEFGTEPVPVDYTYENFVIFDSSEYRFVKRDITNALNKIPEPLVNWEQSLGEPFIDRNGNGIYEPGIDTFIISDDPLTNQDLNHNGVYDSPDDPWAEGIPFDDIDGNGVFRPDPGNHTTGYEPGLPYADYNSNRKHDGDLKAAYCVAGWNTSIWSGSDTACWLTREENALYRFVSDSGLNYDLYMSYNPTLNLLIITSSGLDYRIDGFSVRLLDRGAIVPQDSTEIVVPYYPDPILYYRWVTLGEQLSVDGVSFSDLVKVRVGDNDYRYDFYFSQGFGLLAYDFQEDKTTPPDNWIVYSNNREYYYKKFLSNHPLIFPMTR